MGEIHKKIILEGTECTVEVNALIDTGASDTIISKDIADKIGYEYIEPKDFTVAKKGEILTGAIIELKSMNIVGCIRPKPRVSYAKGLSEEMVLGTNTLQEMGIIIDMERDDITIKECKLKGKIPILTAIKKEE